MSLLKSRWAAAGLAVLLAACMATPENAVGPRPGPGPWSEGPSAFEHAGSDRTSVFSGVSGRSAMDAGGELRVEPVPDRFPGGYNLVINDKDGVFVLGGVLGARNFDGVPYVARVHGETLDTVWRTDLMTDRPVWTYPGMVGILADGSVVAVAGREIVRLDPDTGAIATRATLPGGTAPADTAYNGFIALGDGRLLAKSLHRPTGCGVDGFQAFLQCEGPQETSLLVLLDPVTLETLQTLDLPEPVGGRVTSIAGAEGEDVYLPGADHVYRYRYDGAQLVFDPNWGPVAYRQGRETTGTAIAGFGPYVVVQTNAALTDAPTRLTVISRSDDKETYSLQPFADQGQPRAFIPSKPTTDWENRRIYSVERYGGTAAMDFSPGSGLTRAWIAPERSTGFTALYGSVGDRLLVQMALTEGERPGHPLLYAADRVVFRDPLSGAVLAETGPLAPAPGLNVVPGARGVMWFLGVEGSLYRIRYAAR